MHAALSNLIRYPQGQGRHVAHTAGGDLADSVAGAAMLGCLARHLKGRNVGLGISSAPRWARTIALASMLGLCPIVDAYATSTAAPAYSATAVDPAASLAVRDAWVRWLPGALPAAGYMTLTNTGHHAVTVVGASSPDYGDVMLHQTVRANDRDTMTAVASLRIPAGATVRAAPEAADGYHWMLMHATHPITVGSQVSLRLRLDDGSTIVIRMPVSPPTRLH